MDFFEREYGKKEFGSFGISRGAINAAMTAGVDPRLKYNVLAMGGTDLVALLRHSKQNGVKKYRNKVIDALGISKDEFYEQLRERIKTDPRYLARYMDARNTLLMLGVFDSTVPFKYGQQLREDIGGPPTVYLAADHFTGLLFTQIASIAMPGEQTILPVDYLEREGLAFYRKAFKKKSSWWMFPFRLLQAPFSLVGSLIMNDRAEDDDEEQEFVPQPPSGGGGRGGLVTAFVGK
jgi:hypothetical protein